MVEVDTDSRGRVTIPEHVRERFGDRYRLVALDDCIKLVPIPDDPAAALGDAASNEFSEASFDDLRDTAIEEGRDQALE